jgi:hypothetical protein
MAGKILGRKGTMTNPVVISELNRLAEENNGVLEPERVVVAASAADSPLHSFFEWNDGEAAAQFRITQARKLIRVCVSYIGPKEAPVLSRVFVSLSSDRRDGGGYRPMVEVLSDDAMRSRMLRDAMEEMARFKRKYQHLQELVNVIEAMDLIAA